MRSRSRFLCLVAGLLSGLACGAAADQGSGPFIPDFWNPQQLLDRPDLDPKTIIRFVTGSDYPPFDFLLPDGTLAGFNVDLARALCDELKVTCTIQAQPWAALLPSLAGREADAVIASLSITPETRKTVAFTRPYYRTPARFVSRADTGLEPPTPDTLKGKAVGVAAGTSHEAYLRDFFASAKIVPFPTTAAARDALKSGAVETVFEDGISAALWLDSDDAAGCCRFRGGPYTESRFFGQGAGIALRKGDVTLRRALDYALAQVSAKGRYADLYLQYFPVGFY